VLSSEGRIPVTESNHSWIASENEVNDFLLEARDIIGESLDNLFIQRERKDQGHDDEYTTIQTMAALDYDGENVGKEIMSLQHTEYVITASDRKRPSSPPFWIFEKVINSRSIYIKFKIKNNSLVFCMSFHFAKWTLSRPYQK
jgi:hypothetical protein